MFHLKISEVTSPKGKGYGRDDDEALANHPTGEEEGAFFRDVIIVDVSEDANSAEIANYVCDYWLNECKELPDADRACLATLMEHKRYASAVNYLFNNIFDGDFFEKMSP